MIVIAASEHEYDEFLAVHLELSKPIDRATGKKLEALYSGWQHRVERASRAMAKADGDDDDELGARFDSLTVTGTRAFGGGSRILTLGTANDWLVSALRKLGGVEKVVFGEEDVASAAPAPSAPSQTPTTAKLTATVKQLLGENTEAATVLGLVSIHFDGAGVKRLGAVLRALIDEAMGLADPTGERAMWVRGCWGVGAGLEEINQGKNVREKAGQALLDRVLGEISRMPADERDPRIVALVISDGPRPERKSGCWVDGSRTAASFGVRLSLEAPNRRLPGGRLEVSVPLADLESPDRREAWLAYGQRAFTALRCSVGGCGLGLWMEALTPEDVPLELLASLPTLSIPRLVGDHAGGFCLPDFSPSLDAGFFEPHWVSWLSPALASKVTAFSGTRTSFENGVALRVELEAPLVMNDARYARYQKAWSELEALRIRWAEPIDDDRYPWRRAVDRFDAPRFSQLPAFLSKRLADCRRRAALHWEIEGHLRSKAGAKALAAAWEAMTLGAGASGAAQLLNAAILTGGPALAKARTAALPFVSTHRDVALLSAKASMLIGQSTDALDALRAAPPSRADAMEALETDDAFVPLHGEAAFRAAFGWLPSQPTNVSPDLTAFKRLKKVIEKSPARFNRGASAAELKTLEKALELPKAWLAVLASFNGAAFRDGRDHLYSTTELVAANANKADWQPISVGRRLELRVGKSTVGLFRKTATTDRTSKTIDEGLAALATGLWDQ